MTTVQQIMDTLIKEIPEAPFPETVDTLKAGSADQEVTGIVTTFLASMDVLKQAVDLGANLIIAHEPTYYNHLDETDWLEDDAVYRAKRQFIEDNHLAIWRFHDYWHSAKPDGIVSAVFRALGWEWDGDFPIVRVPSMPLIDVVNHVKRTLGVQTARVVGSLDMPCERIGVMVGHPGGRWQMTALGMGSDVLIAGEINEWETNEYVRDALSQGQRKALVVIGHERSEEVGMAHLAEWVRERIPGITVTHVPTGDVIQFV